MSKCIMAHPLVAPALTLAIMVLRRDGTESYLVSGGYTPLPIPIPSTSGDEARFHAIMMQLEYSALLVMTFCNLIKTIPNKLWLLPRVLGWREKLVE